MDAHLPPLSYAPDGLHESDVDALIAEYFPAAEVDASSIPVVDRVAERRRVRRFDRQVISVVRRGLSGTAATGEGDAAA
jgi:hypothetical protein